MPEESESQSAPKAVKKVTAPTKKYHVVRSRDPKEVAKYIMPCPADKRNGDNEAPIREFASKNTYCTNFKESFFVLHRDKYKIKWETIKEGVEGGMVDGLEL